MQHITELPHWPDYLTPLTELIDFILLSRMRSCGPRHDPVAIGKIRRPKLRFVPAWLFDSVIQFNSVRPCNSFCLFVSVRLFLVSLAFHSFKLVNSHRSFKSVGFLSQSDFSNFFLSYLTALTGIPDSIWRPHIWSGVGCYYPVSADSIMSVWLFKSSPHWPYYLTALTVLYESTL